MNPTTLAIISLRALGTLFGLQGQTQAASALGLLADGLESGVNVDAHMAAVADALKAGTPAAWDEAHAAIIADSARLQG